MRYCANAIMPSILTGRPAVQPDGDGDDGREALHHNRRMKSQAFFPRRRRLCARLHEAFAQADVEALMSVWRRTRKSAAYPAAAPLYGFAAVRAAWEVTLPQLGQDAHRIAG